MGRWGVERLSMPPQHDCAYVALRESLIPKAERVADWVMPRGDRRWGTVFLAAMDGLMALDVHAEAI